MEGAVERDRAAENENTRRSYRAGWDKFTDFCEEAGRRALPAAPETVVMFAERLASDGYAPGTVEVRLSAVARRHKDAGETNPCQSEPVRRQMKNIRRTTDHDPDRKAPILMEHLQQMHFDTSELSELRDRALLFVGFAGGFRRSELVGLRCEDIRDAEGGLGLRVRRSKTDQEGRGRTVQIPDRVPGLEPTPNEALRKWLSAAGIESGALFRMVDRWGNVRDGALSGQSVYEIVRDRMEAIGEDPEPYGGHSLRAGFATQAYMDGIGEHEAAAQTGHSKLDTLREYQRVNVVMEDHPLTRMGASTD
jgi:site-specific recombinase XerD